MTTTPAAQPAPRSVLLLDTASLYFRAFYGVPDTVQAADDTPVNAVRGLLDMIAFLLTDRRPARLVACWDDAWRPTWRVAAIPSYKAQRVAGQTPDGRDFEETPARLVPQIPIIIEVLAAFGIARLGAPDFEADDVIGTLVSREAGRTPIDIVTGDRDLFQLVDDAAGVRVLYPAKGIRALETVDQAWLAAKYGLTTGAAYRDMAILRGDPSDGLPGVPGIGEKTAVTLITRYGSLAGLLRTLNLVDPRLTATQRRRLNEARDYLATAPKVVQIEPNAPVPTLPDAVPTRPADPDRLAQLSEQWNLGRSVTRLTDAMAQLAR